MKDSINGPYRSEHTLPPTQLEQALKELARIARDPDITIVRKVRGYPKSNWRLSYKDRHQ